MRSNDLAPVIFLWRNFYNARRCVSHKKSSANGKYSEIWDVTKPHKGSLRLTVLKDANAAHYHYASSKEWLKNKDFFLCQQRTYQ